MHISSSTEPITLIWVSLERSFPTAGLVRVKMMPILFKGDDVRSGTKANTPHGQHRSQWVNLISFVLCFVLINIYLFCYLDIQLSRLFCLVPMSPVNRISTVYPLYNKNIKTPSTSRKKYQCLTHKYTGMPVQAVQFSMKFVTWFHLCLFLYSSNGHVRASWEQGGR